MANHKPTLSEMAHAISHLLIQSKAERAVINKLVEEVKALKHKVALLEQTQLKILDSGR